MNNPLNEDFSIPGWRVRPMRNRIESRFEAAMGTTIGTINGNTRGSSRSLEPRLMKLLCFMAANADQVMSRDELVAEIWPRVIVNENSLTRAISELRKQLQSDQITPNYIETIPKKGYRFSAWVKLDQLEETVKSGQSVKALSAPGTIINPNNVVMAAIKSRSQLHSARMILSTSLVLVLSLWFIVAQLEQEGQLSAIEPQGDMDSYRFSDEVITASQPWQQTTDARFVLSANKNSISGQLPASANLAISRDQQKVAYIMSDNDGSTIYLAPIQNPASSIKLFSSEYKLFNLTWSPVGNALLFASRPVISHAVIAGETPQYSDEAALIMLDLDTMKISLLLNNSGDSSAELAAGLRLT